MQIKLTEGIEQLQFGMLPKDVESIYGQPDKKYTDEDGNTIYLYFEQKWRLTFYEEENDKLGFIIGSHKDLNLLGVQIIGKKFDDIISSLTEKNISLFTEESFDTYLNYFNEDNWLILQTEYGEIVKCEIGAIINSKDEFDWKFKKQEKP